MTVALVPIGAVSGDLLAWLAQELPKTLGQETVTLSALSLPQEGYDPQRDQYRGSTLISYLRNVDYPTAERIIALVAADCYTPGLNFIFGQATMGGSVAFVALPRLRPSYYGRPEDADLFQERVLKEVVHELGHTWGLSHCSDPKCVMHFSNTLNDTDVKGTTFCQRCQSSLPDEVVSVG